MSRTSRSVRAAASVALLLAAAELLAQHTKRAAREADATLTGRVTAAAPGAGSSPAPGAGSPAAPTPVAAAFRSPPEDGAEEALGAHYEALEKHDTAAAGRRLTSDYFYIAPWGALEFRDENLARYRKAFDSGSLRDYRVEIRAVHMGPAGEDARWFRAIVREKYLRESGRKARNAFAEDLLTSGLAVFEEGAWRIRFMQQTWSDETLRKMIPILHAAQPVDPEEY